MVKVLNRDSIIRMVGTSGGGSSVYAGGGGGGGGASALYECSDVARDGNKVSGAAEGKALVYGSDGKWYAADSLTNLNVTGQLKMGSKLVATQEWVGQNYLSISFFSSLFKAYAGTDEVTPNNSTANVDNIKAMFGFWTEQYLSARGRGAGGGGGGGTGNVTWDELAGTAATGRKVDISYLADAISTLTGYTTSGRNYAVQLNASNQMYVNVPWTDHYAWSDITGKPSAAGGATQPIYWDGSAFQTTTYTLGKSVPADAKFTDTTYSAGAGMALDGTAFVNAGVRSTTINGNYLRVNTNGTNADLTIPYATNASMSNKLSVMATLSGQNTTNYPWRLLASRAEIKTNYVDTEAVIILRQFAVSGRTGILKIAFRTNEIATTASGGSVVWLDRYGFNVDDVKIAVYWEANKSYADVFLKATAWNRMELHVIGNRSWTFYSSSEGTDGADPVNAYTSIEAAATSLHGRAYTNIIAAVDGGTVSYANSAGSATKATQDSDGNAINTTYLKISFFRSLFKAYAGNNEVVPNSGDTSTIDNIKAMFGFWTEQYISARGRGAGGGGGGGTGNVTWDELAGTAATGRKVDISYLTDAISTMTGYTTSGRNYAVEKNASNQLYVNVPWTDHYDWSDITNKPTTLGGYGITDAKIQNGVITLGSNTITPLTSHQTVTDGDPTLAWSTRSKVATIGSTDIHVTMPANPDTWRPVQDNLTSTSTTDCLSANQGKTLKGYIDTLNGYFDNSGVANSAAKLTTVSKTAWGQTFWTANGVPDSISGNMTNVGDISFSASGKKIGGFLYFDTTNSRLGVGASSPSYNLHVDGTGYFSDHLYVANNKGIYMMNASTSAYNVLDLSNGNELHVGYGTSGAGYSTIINGNAVYLKYGTSRTNGMILDASGNVGIGTTSPSHKLSVSGDIVATGCLTARVTSASDIHAKNISTTVLPLTLVEIANAPTIRFKWKQGDDKEDHVGSIAQYWQSVMPEVIWKNKEGMLTLEYGTAALISSITIAREVVALKRRIKEMEAKLKN